MRHTHCAKTVAMLLCYFACTVNHSYPKKLSFGQCSHMHTMLIQTTRKVQKEKEILHKVSIIQSATLHHRYGSCVNLYVNRARPA